MSNLPFFGEYAAAFETTLNDDNWQRLERYFTEDAVYLPGDGTEASGRSAAIQALKDSVDSLERRCDSRDIAGEPGISETDNRVTLTYTIKYTRSGVPDFYLKGTETIDFTDGAISRMEDVFEDPDALHQFRAQLAS